VVWHQFPRDSFETFDCARVCNVRVCVGGRLSYVETRFLHRVFFFPRVQLPLERDLMECFGNQYLHNMHQRLMNVKLPLVDGAIAGWEPGIDLCYTAYCTSRTTLT
jgi:hypothetical protein